MIRQGTNILKENQKNRLDFKADLKQINFLDRRVYKRDEGVYYPSVTTILQYMPKNKFFDNWLKDVGHNADLIMRKAGKEGTQVHEAAEALVKGEEVNWMDDYGNAKYSQIVWEMILKFYDFWNTYKPELISTEEFVFSDKFKYAGTADLVVKMDGETWLLDLKTSNSLHRALATVVLPHPGGPDKRRLGTSPLSRKALNVFLILSGRIHSSIVLGRYFSTQTNSSRLLISSFS